MTWNHRVIRTEDAGGPCYAIHEVIYGENGKIEGWTEEAMTVLSETRRGLFWMLSVMTEAVAKPVLEKRGNELVEIEPAQELSDNLKAAIEHGELIGRGDDEYNAVQ